MRFGARKPEFQVCTPHFTFPAYPAIPKKRVSARSSPFPLGKSTMNYSCSRYELKCNECGKRFGNQPLSACPDCLAPLEIAYDLVAVRGIFTRENIAAGPANIWRYAALLPIPDGFQPDLPVGFTPLVRAKNLGKRIGATNLYIKNDAVCFPTLSFKDRVVSVALANAQKFGFETVGCSSTGNLANSVAAQSAR